MDIIFVVESYRKPPMNFPPYRDLYIIIDMTFVNKNLCCPINLIYCSIIKIIIWKHWKLIEYLIERYASTLSQYYYSRKNDQHNIIICDNS